MGTSYCKVSNKKRKKNITNKFKTYEEIIKEKKILERKIWI